MDSITAPAGYQCGSCGSWVPNGMGHSCTGPPPVRGLDPAFWPSQVRVIDLTPVNEKLNRILSLLESLEKRVAALETRDESRAARDEPRPMDSEAAGARES